MKEFALRSLSALVLGVLVLAITWWGPGPFAVLCGVGGVILAREWWGLTRQRSRWFILLGVVYVGAGVASLVALRLTDIRLVYSLFIMVWVSDIGAYIAGKCFGRHKLAPTISPGKTWEGVAGSLVLLTAALMDLRWPWVAVCIALLVTFVGLAGDLFESSLKRRAGVKDSGRLIPGHGGLFDRVDALLPCAVVMLLAVAILSAIGAPLQP